jgi:hypothetical protein
MEYPEVDHRVYRMPRLFYRRAIGRSEGRIAPSVIRSRQETAVRKLDLPSEEPRCR